MQLAEILLAEGLVDEGQLSAAFDEHQRIGRSLGRVLVDQGVLTGSAAPSAGGTRLCRSATPTTAS